MATFRATRSLFARFPRRPRSLPYSRCLSTPAASSSGSKDGDDAEKPAPAPPSTSSSFASKALERAPGIALAGGVMAASFGIADVLGTLLLESQGVEAAAGAKSPISGIPVSILLGGLLGNAVTLPKAVQPGLGYASKTILRAGVVCVGIKLSLTDVAHLGVTGLPVVVGAVSAGLLFAPWMGRQLGLAPRLSSLIAAGTSICGVTAITALSPAIKASKQETAVAVANVVAFGTMGMLCYPYLAHHVWETSEQIGMFLGTAVHDTSQVMGSALTYRGVYGDEVVVQTAAVTKLTRNMFLAGVIPGLTWWHARMGAAPGAPVENGGEDTSTTVAPKLGWQDIVPSFVIGFVGMSALRTVGDATLATEGGAALGVFDGAQWKQLTSFVGGTLGAQLCMGTAMAAVGLGIKKDVFKGVGYKPFLLGGSAALVVSGTGTSMILLVSQFA